MKKLRLIGILLMLPFISSYAQVTIDKNVNLTGAGDEATLRIGGNIFVRAIGTSTLLGNTQNTTNSGNDNIFIGYQAGKSNTTATSNTFIGIHAGYNTTTGTTNLFLGYDAGYANTNGTENIFIGYRAGRLNSSGGANICIGYGAGDSGNGSYNTIIGPEFAGAVIGSGSRNIMIGDRVGYLSSGSNNIFLGEKAGFNTTGNYNIFLGIESGYTNTTGSSNMYLGYQSGYTTTNSTQNTYLGYQTGNISTGSSNTFIGYKAGYGINSGSNNIFIGASAAPTMTTTIRHSVIIGNGASTNQDSTMVFGAFQVVKRWSFGRISVPSGAAFIVGFDGTDGNGAYLTTGGTWTNTSDKNKKENFVTLNGQDILNKVVSLPITQWNYKGENASIKHIGPMAQDFYRVFQVGNDNTSISTIDPAGIALVAIQELYKKDQTIEKQLEEINKLKADVNKLQNNLDIIKAENQIINQEVAEIKSLLKKGSFEASKK